MCNDKNFLIQAIQMHFEDVIWLHFLNCPKCIDIWSYANFFKRTQEGVLINHGKGVIIAHFTVFGFQSLNCVFFLFA